MHAYANEIKILYVEDENDVREGYARSLQRVCKELFTAEDGVCGLEMYKLHSPDLVISDINMPNKNGLEMVQAIKEINPHANIIFTTAHSESAYLLEAIELQVEGYLLKPVGKKTLIDRVQKLAKNIVLEKENIEQREMLQHIIDSDNSMSLVTDLYKISFASKSFLRFFQVEEVEELNKKFSSVFDFLQDNNTLINKQNILASLSQGNTLFDFIENIDEIDRIVKLRHEDDLKKSFLVNISKISKTNFLISLTDVTQIQIDKEETAKKAYTDGLTGVANRNKFEEVFEYEFNKTLRYKEPLSIAILDIDHFKLVNDNFGHLIGDEVLVCLAQTLQKSIRISDFFARWGGEEFVLLFPATDLKNAVLSAEKFRKIGEDIKHENVGKVTISVGLSQYKEGDTLESMLQRADKALYEAKNSGRNCVKSLDE